MTSVSPYMVFVLFGFTALVSLGIMVLWEARRKNRNSSTSAGPEKE